MKEPRPRDPAISTLAVGGVLLVLAGASYVVSFLALGVWSLPIAIAIAVLKAALVVSVFMELRHETASIQLASVAAAFMLLLLVALTAADVATRAASFPSPPFGGTADRVGAEPRD